MPLIEVGVDFNAAEEATKIQPLPEGDYEFQIESAEIVQCGENSKTPGRPMVKWTLRTINADDPQHNNRPLFYNTPLPWTNPQTGEFDDSALGFLVALTKAVGRPWNGTSLNTDEYIGLTGLMRVGVREYNGELRNEVKKLYEKS